MSDDQMEPGGTTERFRAFAEAKEPEPVRNPRAMIGIVVGVAVLVLAIILYFAL